MPEKSYKLSICFHFGEENKAGRRERDAANLTHVFTNGTKLGEAVNTWDVCNAIQRDFNNLEKCVDG